MLNLPLFDVSNRDFRPKPAKRLLGELHFWLSWLYVIERESRVLLFLIVLIRFRAWRWTKLHVVTPGRASHGGVSRVLLVRFRLSFVIILKIRWERYKPTFFGSVLKLNFILQKLFLNFLRRLLFLGSYILHELHFHNFGRNRHLSIRFGGHGKHGCLFFGDLNVIVFVPVFRGLRLFLRRLLHFIKYY